MYVLEEKSIDIIVIVKVVIVKVVMMGVLLCAECNLVNGVSLLLRSFGAVVYY